MTLNQTIDIFKTKYPSGDVWKDGNKTCIAFTKGGKVYGYNVCNYVELLNRLGFNVIYAREKAFYEREINKLEGELERGYIKALLGDRKIYLTDAQKAERVAKIAQYKEEIEKSVIVEG